MRTPLYLSTAVFIRVIMKSNIVVKNYNLENGFKDVPCIAEADKKGKTSLRIVLMSDLHFHGQGDMPAAKFIAGKISEISPDLVICAGDLVYADPEDDYAPIKFLFEKIHSVCPCFAVNGNYESKIRALSGMFGDAYDRLGNILDASGVVRVNNRSVLTDPGNGNKNCSKNCNNGTETAVPENGCNVCDGQPILKENCSGDSYIRITGYEAPLSKYKKFRTHDLPLQELEQTIGKCDKTKYNILVAHNPLFADTYFEWGADLILCGHFHGGLARIGDRALMSPYGFPLPKYGYGRYDKNRQTLIISAGAGNNRVKVRINDPKEIVSIDITL